MLYQDALIIGAGPAGLTAATYLGRFRRPPLIVDGGASRARWIPVSHNIPGFAEGIAGSTLLAGLREQAIRYGTQVIESQVNAISRTEKGFAVHTATQAIHARYVILATGVLDHLPELPGAEEAVLRSVLRVCPVCDAFEATDKNIAVIGAGVHAERESKFLRFYSERVTLLHLGHSTDEVRRRMTGSGISVTEAHLADLKIQRNDLRVNSKDGSTETFDVFYAALGCSPQNQLATDLGAKLDENGALIVNAHQETTVAGLYAAGDIVRGLNQVVVAAAEAAIAATDIHNRLCREH